VILQLRVMGVAIPKGSTKSHAYYAKNRQTGQIILNRHGKPILLTSTSNANPNTRGWQTLVASRLTDAIAKLPAVERGILTEGVRMTIAFYLPRPKSLPKKVTAHTKAPDLDKLARSIFDACTKVVYRDDSQVVDLVTMKRYTLGSPYVDLRVEPAPGLGVLASQQPLFEMAR
jgi:Holliday junction resolvase RusA-like endonuclease